jgi:predicted glutamine amidotransferase
MRKASTMCELLALSSSRPVQLTFSLRALAARGSAAGHAGDGWGVAFYQGPDVALFREPAAAAGSALVNHLESQGPPTQLAISHIRHATRGALSLANTQPFVRELGGRSHVFAHNGDLPGLFSRTASAAGGCRPVGQTDSEFAFCDLLSRLGALWQAGDVPPLDARLSVLAALAAEWRAFGPANFLYADGDALFAHGHRRIQRQAGRIEPPGLWLRQRQCVASDAPADAAGASVAPRGQTVVWLASVPLTDDDDWRPLDEGELVAVRAGVVLATRPAFDAAQARTAAGARD